MLGDMARTQQNLSDYDPKLAKAIDEYMEAQVAMMKAIDAAVQRMERGQEVTAGQVTVEKECLMQLCQSMNTLAEQAAAAVVSNLGAASSFLYLKRRRAQAIVLDIQKGSKHD